MQSPLNNFEFNSTAHARACGIATGAFIKAGIPIRPIYDDSGNYVPAFIVEIENKTYCLTLTPLK